MAGSKTWSSLCPFSILPMSRMNYGRRLRILRSHGMGRHKKQTGGNSWIQMMGGCVDPDFMAEERGRCTLASKPTPRNGGQTVAKGDRPGVSGSLDGS